MDKRIKPSGAQLAAQSDPVTLEAAEWMLELQSRTLSEDRLAAWHVWLAADARHRQAFDRLQTVQECLDAIPQLPWPTDSEVEADAGSPVLPGAARGILSRYRLALAAGVAALAIGVSFALYLNRGASQSDVIETAVGELRRVPLADGSTVTAGGRSRVAVQFDGARRDVRLESGEAFFEVARDPSRPFVVRAGDAAIKAIGTAFNVRRTGAHTIVAVAEGVVEAAGPAGTARLSAGQQIRLGPKSTPAPIAMAPDAVAAWRERQRQYRAEPLADVVADLARYSTRHIVIQDERIGQLAVTGTVFEREIDKWLNSLEGALPVQVRTDADGTVRISALPAN